MKRNIRCIYIDGIEKSGKTSIVREMRKFLKEKEKDLHEIHSTDILTLNKQKILLEDNEKSFILKENGLMSLYYNEFNQYRGVGHIEGTISDLIHQERIINHNYGAVHFFLIPENVEVIRERFENEVPEYMQTVIDFYKNINLYSIAQGLDIRLILFDEYDRIYDIRDKILKSLEEDYKI